MIFWSLQLLWLLIILADCHLLSQNTELNFLRKKYHVVEKMSPCKISVPYIKDGWRSCRNLLKKKRMAKWGCGGSATIITSVTMFLCKGIQGIWWAFFICSSFSVICDMELWDQVCQSNEHSRFVAWLRICCTRLWKNKVESISNLVTQN